MFVKNVGIGRNYINLRAKDGTVYKVASKALNKKYRGHNLHLYTIKESCYFDGLADSELRAEAFVTDPHWQDQLFSYDTLSAMVRQKHDDSVRSFFVKRLVFLGQNYFVVEVWAEEETIFIVNKTKIDF